MNIVKVLLFSGISLIILAGVIFFVQKTGLPLGRLPGDIYIKHQNNSFYFPLTTCLLASLLISLLFYLFRR